MAAGGGESVDLWVGWTGWSARVEAPALAAAFGNLGILKSVDMEIPDMCYPNNQENTNSQNPNPFCPKCQQGLD